MIDNLINQVKSQTTNKTNFEIDEIKKNLITISNFFDIVDNVSVSNINSLYANHIPYSSFYNNFISKIQGDINLIYDIQEEIKNNIVTSWNSVETELLETITEDISKYDNNFSLEFPKATYLNDQITSAIEENTSFLSLINGEPNITVKTNNVNIVPFFGKQFGLYIPGSENAEDGVRVCTPGEALMNDSLFEVEAVTLSKQRNNTVFFQKYCSDDIILYCSIKYIFKEAVEANAFKIIPHNFASNTYFRLSKIDISDGILTSTVDMKDIQLREETVLAFNIPDNFIDKKIKSITYYFYQDTSYPIKYTLGYFTLGSNKSWLDVTGQQTIEIGLANRSVFNEGISFAIENAPQWILNYWLPNVQHKEVPKLDVTQGNNGYIDVSSAESYRKRYAIGINKIDIMNSSFANISEIVTQPLDIPINQNTVELTSEYIGNVMFFMSFDDGISWNRINTKGSLIEYDDNLKVIPTKLYINSDLSLKRKQNTESGEKAFVENSNNKMRLKFILINENNIVPVVKNWSVNFGVENE